MAASRPAGSNRRRTGVIALALIAACAAQAACRGNERGPRFEAYGHTEIQRGGVLRWSVPSPVDTLDPAIAYDEISLYALHHLYDTLLDYADAASGEGDVLVPMLAESWSVSDDGRVYSFTLREGLQFSDGQPCVAGDFKYALERLPGISRSPFAQFLERIEGFDERRSGTAGDISGIRVIDDRHLAFHLVEPDASFPMLLAMKFTTPLKRSHVERAGDGFRSQPLGTGPFVLERWDEGTRLVFSRNARYWNQPLPYLDGMVVYTAVPRETAFLKFEAGELDTMARLSSADYLWLATRPEWKPYIFNVPAMNTTGARMNTSRPPFNDRRVRQAVNYAIDRRRVWKVLNGRAELAHGMLPPLMMGHHPDLAPYPHDPDRARRLLAEAGYPDGFEITYAIFQDPQIEKVAQSIQADLADVGIDMTIEVMSFPALLATMGRPDGARFSFMAWHMDFPDPTNFLDTNFHSRQISDENSNNSTFYRNPELDRMLDDARREVDADRRRQRYEDIDRLLHDEAPWVWLFHLAYIEVRQPYVAGYRPHAVWLRDYRATWLDVPARRRGRRP